MKDFWAVQRGADGLPMPWLSLRRVSEGKRGLGSTVAMIWSVKKMFSSSPISL